MAVCCGEDDFDSPRAADKAYVYYRGRIAYQPALDGYSHGRDAYCPGDRVDYQPAWDGPVANELESVAFAIADCLRAIAKLSPKARCEVVKQLVKLTEDDE